MEVPLNARSLVHRYTLHDCTVTCLPGIAGLVVSSNFTTALAFVRPPLLTANMTVRFANSWGSEWGDNGYGVLSWAGWEKLLHSKGDVTVPVPPQRAAPR